MNVDEKTGAALPRISVIIPVLDGARVLERCLAALAASALRDFEVIVVDDGSADGSAALAEAAGARVIRQARSRGAAAARNLGAGGARGEVLYFLDADVLVQPGTLSAIADDIAAGADAVIGSYTPDTPEKGFFSKFKNVHHHYIHQISSEKAVTFWTGCGAVKRDAFRAVGGFDEKIYGGATVEDIEFGYRLTGAGFNIRLAKDITVSHLKAYGLWSMMTSDIFNRAVPWTKLMILRRHFRSDLNTTPSNALSVLLSGAIIAGLLAAPFCPWALVAAGVFFVLFTLNTMPFNRYVKRHFNWPFTIATVITSVWYFCYAGVGLVFGVISAAWEAARGNSKMRRGK